MKRCRRLFLFGSFWTAVAMAALPVPPQSDPWTPPKVHGIPDLVVDTARALFDAGLADPRGGEYRIIKIRLGMLSHESAQVAEVHGWLFESGLAVLWSGLVYKVEEDLGPADLATDVGADRKNGLWLNDETLPYFTRPARGPITLFLLLRLNQSRLAEQLWRQNLATGYPFVGSGGEASARRYFRGCASYWLADAFQMGTSAYMNGDDRVALDVFQPLELWNSRAKEQAAT
jgi:hypothetical protein